MRSFVDGVSESASESACGGCDDDVVVVREVDEYVMNVRREIALQAVAVDEEAAVVVGAEEVYSPTPIAATTTATTTPTTTPAAAATAAATSTTTKTEEEGGEDRECVSDEVHCKFKAVDTQTDKSNLLLRPQLTTPSAKSATAPHIMHNQQQQQNQQE